jgi:hypothetical protein
MHGFPSSEELFTRSRVSSIDGLGLNLGVSPTLENSFSAYFPVGLGAVGSSTPSRTLGSHSHGSMVSSHTHSTRSSSVSNEDECRAGNMSDRAFTNVASVALNEYSDLSDPEEQKKLIADQLFPLVETFKPFLARSITDYLVNNAACSELMEVLQTPDLLLPHYIAVALSMMSVATSEKN